MHGNVIETKCSLTSKVPPSFYDQQGQVVLHRAVASLNACGNRGDTLDSWQVRVFPKQPDQPLFPEAPLAPARIQQPVRIQVQTATLPGGTGTFRSLDKQR